MPWDIILGGAGVGTVVLVLALVAAHKFAERAVENRYDEKLTSFKHHLDEKMAALHNEVDRRLESHKSEFEVWNDVRKEILLEMWAAHRAIAKAMSTVILLVQEDKDERWSARVEQAIDDYRHSVHDAIGFFDPAGLEILQNFIEVSYPICFGEVEPQDANPLKQIRGQLPRTWPRYTASAI